MTEEAQKLRIDSACNVAEQFTKLYFETFDQKRHAMNRFYMDSATLSWDGNHAVSKELIQKFLQDIPETSHILTALDAQPVFLDTDKSQQTVLVQVGGLIKFPKLKDSKGFTRTFLITSQDDKWKIVTDCCRLQVPLTGQGNS